MKKTILSAALVAVMGVAAFAPKIASAADGTITFTGNITATTCTITGGGAASGTGDIQVDMPTVSTAALPSGATAGYNDLLAGRGCRRRYQLHQRQDRVPVGRRLGDPVP